MQSCTHLHGCWKVNLEPGPHEWCRGQWQHETLSLSFHLYLDVLHGRVGLLQSGLWIWKSFPQQGIICTKHFKYLQILLCRNKVKAFHIGSFDVLLAPLDVSRPDMHRDILSQVAFWSASAGRRIGHFKEPKEPGQKRLAVKRARQQ